jgi:hypothetical protein
MAIAPLQVTDSTHQNGEVVAELAGAEVAPVAQQAANTLAA